MDNRIILLAAFLLLSGCTTVRETSDGAGPSQPETGQQPVQNQTMEPAQPTAAPPPDVVPPANASSNTTNKTPAKGEGTIVDVGGSIPIQGN